MSPKTGIMFGHRWMFKNAEPSDLALLWTGIGGVVCIAIAIWLMFSGLEY